VSFTESDTKAINTSEDEEDMHCRYDESMSSQLPETKGTDMGLADRDYMRERDRDRVASPSRRQARQSGLEVLLAAPFSSQGIAITLGLIGLILISSLPASMIMSMAVNGAVQSTDPDKIIAQATQRGMLGGVMILMPTIRLMGLVLLTVSGVALVKQRRRWGYSTIIKDPIIAACIGTVAMGIAVWSVATQGIWASQAKEASRAVARIASGQVQTSTIRTSYPGPAIVVRDKPIAQKTMTPGLPQAELPQDRPFPNNGTFERSLPLQGRIASMTFANRSQNNTIVVWYYNLNKGQGDQEALRLYLKAGQSSSVDIPAFDYRMAVYEAPVSYGLDRGFGPNAKPVDLGLVDLKAPTQAFIQQPSGSYLGYGIFQVRPGTMGRR
jgi:hypothetical protein